MSHAKGTWVDANTGPKSQEGREEGQETPRDGDEEELGPKTAHHMFQSGKLKTQGDEDEEETAEARAGAQENMNGADEQKKTESWVDS